MPKEKAAMFVDNSNIFKGMYAYTVYLRKTGSLESDRYLRLKWDGLIEKLESQNEGLDIYARHFFASLPPAADVSKMTRRPSEEEWNEMVKKSAQTGFYRAIQNPPFNFTLHPIPLRIREINCGNWMRRAYFRCFEAYGGEPECNLSLNPDDCFGCDKKFLYKYEKGIDVALAAELVIFSNTSGAGLDRIILVAGDGDYKEAIRFARQQVGKDIQIVTWRRALAKDLEKLANKATIYLDDDWESLCEVRKKPPLEESPAVEEVSSEDEE